MGTVAEAVSALRNLVGVSQEELGKRSGLTRTEMVKLEGGKNQATSDRIRAALAQGFGLLRDDVDALLTGRIDAGEAYRRIGRARPIEGELPDGLGTVLASAEGRGWSPETVVALRAIATASTEPWTEEQWLQRGRGYELVNRGVSAPRVVADVVKRKKRAGR